MEAALTAIKIGANIVGVKKGDYVQESNGKHTFHSGNNRTLVTVGKEKITSLYIPSREVKNLPFKEMTRIEEGQIIKWIF